MDINLKYEAHFEVLCEISPPLLLLFCTTILRLFPWLFGEVTDNITLDVVCLQ